MFFSGVNSQDCNPYFSLYKTAVIAVGAAVIVFSTSRLPVERLDGRFLLLAVITLICSRATIEFPFVKSRFSFSDPLIFLAILLYGGEAGVLLAAMDGVVASLHYCKKRVTVVFNAAMMAFSIFLTVAIGQMFFGPVENLPRPEFSFDLMFALCVMGVTHYLINTATSAVWGAIISKQSFRHTWKTSYL